jgi:hypothetical protein
MRALAIGILCVFAPPVAFSATPETATSGELTVEHSELCSRLKAPAKSVEFMGFFPTEGAAVRAAASIDDDVFEVVAREAADRKGWVVSARYRSFPLVHVFEQHSAEMLALGRSHGGSGLLPGCTSHPYRR